jgi:hypothetical protein
VDNTVVRGFVSRKFHDDSEHQTIGGQIVAPHIVLADDLSDDQAEQQRRIQTTLSLTRKVLEQEQARYGVDLVRPFLRMLVFDAWIGNGDRHSANWAHLVRTQLHGDACRLAPMYDTAGCLLSEQKDDSINTRFGTRFGSEELDAIARYIAKCPSGFGDGVSRPGISHRELLEQLQQWPEWPEIAPSLIVFFSANLGMVSTLLEEIPVSWLSDRRKELIRALLEGRVKMLQGL